MSRKDISSECLYAPDIKTTHSFFVDGDVDDSLIGRGLQMDRLNYQEGYFGIAIRILDLIRMSNNNAIKDSYIYVSLFCFRHFLELSMKDTIIHYYNKKEEASSIIRNSGHNLISLYNELSKLPGVHSDDVSKTVSNMLNTIQGYDPTGTVFRYPYRVNENGIIEPINRRHIGLKNIRVLKTRMMQLYNYFDGINSMICSY